MLRDVQAIFSPHLQQGRQPKIDKHYEYQHIGMPLPSCMPLQTSLHEHALGGNMAGRRLVKAGTHSSLQVDLSFNGGTSSCSGTGIPSMLSPGSASMSAGVHGIAAWQQMFPLLGATSTAAWSCFGMPRHRNKVLLAADACHRSMLVTK